MNRLIFSLALLLLLSGCANIDQALYNVSDAVSSHDMVTGKRALNMTNRHTQIQRSNTAMSRLIKETYTNKGKSINQNLDKKSYDRILRVFNRVKAVSHVRGEKWAVYLVPNDEFNAFVMGGSGIVLNSGLLKEIKNDDELAAVIGHEIAHVSANHVYERNAQTMAATLNRSNSIKRGSFSAAFTHEGEREADEVGILYAALAGYDPYAASRVWERNYKKNGNTGIIFHNHPMNSERAKNTKDIAKKVQPYYKKNVKNSKYETILVHNTVYKTYFNQNEGTAGKGGGFMAVLNTTAQALTTHENAKTEERRQRQHIQNLNLIKRAITVEKVQPLSKTTVRVVFSYSGNKALKNISLIAKYGSEVVFYQPKKLWYPKRNMVAQFVFKETNISKVTKETLEIGLDDARW